MRPSYAKTHKKLKCKTKRNISYKTRLCGYSGRIACDLDDINQALNIHKSKLAKGSWKVVPKDSCEVYKNRRRRQIESQKRDCERDNSTFNKKNNANDGCRCNKKQRDDSSKSSYSSDSASETSCSCITDTDN